MSEVELLRGEDGVIAYVVYAAATPSVTTFITDASDPFQAGFVVYGAGGEVIPHRHLPVERSVVGTAEFIVVRSGRCIVHVYSETNRLVATRELSPGDAILTLAGGHGFQMLEDTVLFEVKQGPFLPGLDKVRFDGPARGT
jgi:hypothetical protein